ncbi:hypothetical protein Tco_0138191 [Tanacetum coccineum]
MSDSTGGMTNLADMEDIEMIMQQLQYEQSLQEQEAESSHLRNYIYRERDLAEENLMADYLEICERVAGANNDITVLNNSLLLDDLLDDITLVAPFEVNGVTFQ